ncbi:Lipoyl synthase [Hibiscus syriacus]|uniref:Lipoyl synthase n=1 Tax=Hibiscus syriacus TaxID=106335 RepID=A0A6A3A341_HIBSY|nr:Lipoyl synthase [Hibiscus syriacus]
MPQSRRLLGRWRDWFCNVKTSRTPPPPDPDEPRNFAEVGLRGDTSVDRDDLPDQGSGHFAETFEKLKTLKPKMLIEALVPDFWGDVGCVERVAKSGLDVFAHNIETVEELQRAVVKTMEKVRAAGVDVMTFGQYMRQSKRHMPVSEYITPEAFEKYRAIVMEMFLQRAVAANTIAMQHAKESH